MKINKAGLDIIKKWEGLELKAYLCPAKVLTIGYGSTGPHVKSGMIITKEEAEALLVKDLARFEEGVSKLVPAGCTENQFSALVSFSFNVGLEALTKSTLLKKFKAGDLVGAQEEFGKWSKAGGKVLPGLVKRRADERRLFATA